MTDHSFCHPDISHLRHSVTNGSSNWKGLQEDVTCLYNNGIVVLVGSIVVGSHHKGPTGTSTIQLRWQWWSSVGSKKIFENSPHLVSIHHLEIVDRCDPIACPPPVFITESYFCNNPTSSTAQNFRPKKRPLPFCEPEYQRLRRDNGVISLGRKTGKPKNPSQ